MACCLLCFDDAPVPEDPKAFRPNKFYISMMDGLSINQPVCILTYLCPCCCAYYTRSRVLDNDMSRYSCCQGYMDISCFKAGSCGEQKCPEFCLAVETLCCLGPSVSSSRMFIMDQYDLRPDPCDNRVIRFTNCLMIVSCICDILSICCQELQHAASCMHCIANCTFYTTVGCMTAQVNKEVDFRKDSCQEYTPLMSEQDIIDEGIANGDIKIFTVDLLLKEKENSDKTTNDMDIL